jgi:hypothetical protein
MGRSIGLARTAGLITLEEFEKLVLLVRSSDMTSSNLVAMFPPTIPGCNPVSATCLDGHRGGVDVKASELAKTATTDKGLLPHLSDLVDLSEIDSLIGVQIPEHVHKKSNLRLEPPPRPPARGVHFATTPACIVYRSLRELLHICV